MESINIKEYFFKDEADIFIQFSSQFNVLNMNINLCYRVSSVECKGWKEFPRYGPEYSKMKKNSRLNVLFNSEI